MIESRDKWFKAYANGSMVQCLNRETNGLSHTQMVQCDVERLNRETRQMF